MMKICYDSVIWCAKTRWWLHSPRFGDSLWGMRGTLINEECNLLVFFAISSGSRQKSAKMSQQPAPISLKCNKYVMIFPSKGRGCAEGMMSLDMTDRETDSHTFRELAPLLMLPLEVRNWREISWKKRVENSCPTTLCVNLWPVGFRAAALATVPLLQCGWCACFPQFMPVSERVSLSTLHRAPQLYLEYPKALEHALKFIYICWGINSLIWGCPGAWSCLPRR